ncbi:MAG TPA: LEA type 2 family protein [Paraburkholderia sp.]|jgi:LEA14-like dessication related protein
MDSVRALRFIRFILVVFVIAALGGCAGFGHDPLRVSVAGIDPLDSQGMEMRFNLKLRIQNPNDTPIDYNGISLELDLNGKSFASGVSNESGTVPRYGEALVSVPVTIPALAAVHQVFAFADRLQSGQIPYILRGRLSTGGLTGSTRFIDQGSLSLPFAGADL